MGIPNLTLRGSIYWWRRRITVAGHVVPLALSLRTGLYQEARIRAGHLSAEVEKLRMAYGERGEAVDPATLKKIFSDAMRWQLERILADQTASGVDPRRHAATNLAYAEMWRLFAKPGGQWTADDDERLADAGWPAHARSLVSDLWEQHRHAVLVSGDQLRAYEDRFKFRPTASNLDRVRRVIFSARAEACQQAIKHLGSHPGDFPGWVDAALEDEEPFAFEPVTPTTSSAPKDNGHAGPPADEPRQREPAPPAAPDEPVQGSTKKLLKDAAEECIAEHVSKKAWSRDSVEQVRAAIRLFDHAAGGDAYIEDLRKEHVQAFHALCRDLPNRWGKTKDELERGLPASLEYAAKLKAKGEAHRVGFSSKTINKHITWIEAVLDYAENEDEEDGHRPSLPLKFKTKRSRIGGKAETKQQRARDLRANWTRKEIGRLLEAAIWHGCLDLDHRFQQGHEIYHDAWYWLPLMYVLYGGRSSELAGLPLSDVFEADEIPYFKVDYSDLRRLKNAQSVRRLPIHPELIRLGFIEYVQAMRQAGHELLFPEMYSPDSQSFAATFYRSVFRKWRAWAFPNGTEWAHQARGAFKDKDVHSFRGVASSLMKGKIADSVRFDILGHEGGNTTQSVYDEEAALEEKLRGLILVTPLTAGLPRHPLRVRPPERQKFGAKRGAPRKSTSAPKDQSGGKGHLRLVT